MFKTIKKFLQKAHIYYFVQGHYRRLRFNLSTLATRVSYRKLEGAGYTCNFCGLRYKKFVPRYAAPEDAEALKKYNVIGGDGENVYCPHCRSTCRERLVLQALKERVDFRQKRILHLSPEKNIYNFLKKQANVVTADVEPGFYKLTDKNIIYADARSLPFSNASFDLVIGNHIMEHIPEDTIAMAEIFRVLKPGGKAILQVPFSNVLTATIEEPAVNDPVRQSQLFGQKDHVRIYIIPDYLNRLASVGFTADYITPDKLTGWGKYALQPDEGFIDLKK